MSSFILRDLGIQDYEPVWRQMQPPGVPWAVVVISQDLDELMEISDHFAALNEGRLSEARVASELTIDEIGLMMGGAHGMEVAHV